MNVQGATSTTRTGSSNQLEIHLSVFSGLLVDLGSLALHLYILLAHVVFDDMHCYLGDAYFGPRLRCVLPSLLRARQQNLAGLCKTLWSRRTVVLHTI